MLLVVDNGSVFTQDLLDHLASRSTPFSVVHCSGEAAPAEFDSVILSGRRRSDAAANVLNSKVIRRCISEAKPLLGICYGAEILVACLGGTLRRSARPRAGLHDVQVTRENAISSGTLRVLASHRLEIARLPKTMERIATSEQCRYEMIQLLGSNIFGVQFHPEVTPDGRRLIDKFLEIDQMGSMLRTT